MSEPWILPTNTPKAMLEIMLERLLIKYGYRTGTGQSTLRMAPKASCQPAFEGRLPR